MGILRGDRPFRRIVVFSILFSFAAIYPVSSSPNGTGESIKTNFDLLEDLSGAAAEELISNMPLFPDGTILYLKKDKGVGEIDFVLENVMLVAFRDAGVQITQENPRERMPGEELPSYRLSFQIIRMSLTYPKISRRYWLGAKEVERSAEIDLFAQLVDTKSGDIVWVGDTHKEYEDVIGYSMLEKVEDPEYGFTRPERKELRWSRLIEPVVVGGVVVGLVYLFFSNQSND